MSSMKPKQVLPRYFPLRNCFFMKQRSGECEFADSPMIHLLKSRGTCYEFA